MIIGIFDTETTGLDITQSRILELAIAHYDTEDRRVMASRTWIIHESSFIPNAAADINGLHSALLQRHRESPKECYLEFLKFADKCDYLCAHNGHNFDFPILTGEIVGCGLLFPAQKPLIDTAQDLPFTDGQKSRRLVHLCAEIGFVNPFPHTALSDVLSTAKLLSYYDINDVIARAVSPMVELVAKVEMKDNHLVKARRYRWDGVKREWKKSLKQFDLEKELAETKFSVDVRSL